jgi:hypothetical protein
LGYNEEISTQIYADYEIYQTGTMITTDSAYGLDITWWAPITEDDCHFVIQRKRVYHFEPNLTSLLSIGDLVDWDIPVESNKNTAGSDSSFNLIFQSGGASDNPAIDCRDNTNRFGGIAMIGAGTVNCQSVYYTPYSAYVDPISLHLENNELRKDHLYDGTHQPGYYISSEVDDHISLMTYIGDINLDTEDTLYIYSALISVLEGSVNDLKNHVMEARTWARQYLGVSFYIKGDANGDGTVNVGDAVFLINFVFKGGAAPEPIESGDANCDASCNVGDAVYLINFVFKGGPEPCE